MNLDSYLTTTHKTTQIIPKVRTRKPLKGNIRENLCDLGLDKEFLDQQVIKVKKRNIKLGFIKIKNILNIFREWVPVRGGGHKERGNEVNMAVCFISIHENRRKKSVEIVLRRGKGEERE
jgi:hypothetical protein